MAVTDHDTTAAVAEVHDAARERGIEAISGIEITAVDEGRDLHVLAYFFDPRNERLKQFLASQRAARIARVEAIGARLAASGVPIDVETLVQDATRESGRSVGRPQIARAMIAAGHVVDTREAFDRWLGRGCPGFVPRTGSTAEAVIEIIHEAGGIASLAHPGKLGLESRVGPLAGAGLDALEAFHPDHDATLVARYLQLAREFNLLLTGGSDFHGDPSHGLAPGSVTLPPAEFDRLRNARPDAVR
jgi:predicted metal-dependent phosphoesterase TrpH